MVIGIIGKAGSGKDTVGEIMHKFLAQRDARDNNYSKDKTYNWQIRKFADKLKQMVSILTDTPLEVIEDPMVKEAPLGDDYKLVTYKSGKVKKTTEHTIRTLMQTLGTSWGREMISPDLWVNTLFKNYKEGSKWIITDVRFENEAKAIKDRGGLLIKISSPNEYSFGHTSETSLDNFTKYDSIIDNSGTLEDLEIQVISILKFYRLI